MSSYERRRKPLSNRLQNLDIAEVRIIEARSVNKHEIRLWWGGVTKNSDSTCTRFERMANLGFFSANDMIGKLDFGNTK